MSIQKHWTWKVNRDYTLTREVITRDNKPDLKYVIHELDTDTMIPVYYRDLDKIREDNDIYHDEEWWDLCEQAGYIPTHNRFNDVLQYVFEDAGGICYDEVDKLFSGKDNNE